MIIEGKSDHDGWLRLPIATLPAWAAFNNVQFNAIRIGPMPGFEDRGSTVLANRPLSGASELPLMTVPHELVLSLERVQEHAKADADFRAVFEGLGEFARTARGAILSFLLMQSSTACPLMSVRRGVSTPFTEYVKYLPVELLPTFWTDAERALLVGTTLAPALTAKMNSLYREFEILRTATIGIPWCAEAWWDEVDGLISFNDWLQVDAMYRSRALEFPGIGDCMVPCIDMANHTSGDATAAIYEVDDRGNALLLLCDEKQVDADGEITITYGDNKGACEMLFSYGFIEDNMDSARELFLDLSIPADDPLRRPKAIKADCAPGFKIVENQGTIDWEGEYVWLICVNEEDGLDFKVQQTVDGEQELVATWKDQEMKSLGNLKETLEKDVMWDIFQLRASVVLQSRIASQLTELYGAEDQIKETSHGSGSEIRERVWQLTTKLRDLEGELLEKAYSHFEDMKVQLSQSERVVAYLGAVSSAINESGVEDDFS